MQRTDSKNWGRRFDALVKRIQRRVPADVSPGEIEADITEARREVRQARHDKSVTVSSNPSG